MPDPAPPVADVADRYFQEGHNCAQAVLRAVAEARGLECPRCIPGVALAMGGGVGHRGKTCGAVTGAAMVIGLAVEWQMAAAPILDRKREATRVAGAFVAAFEEKLGSCECASILGFSLAEPGSTERFQRGNLKALKCTPCVRWAAAEADRLVAGLGQGGAGRGA
jgi:C_GCAxxG_C_C family probable redox protein